MGVVILINGAMDEGGGEGESGSIGEIRFPSQEGMGVGLFK